jgi:hypothetical protein
MRRIVAGPGRHASPLSQVDAASMIDVSFCSPWALRLARNRSNASSRCRSDICSNDTPSAGAATGKLFQIRHCRSSARNDSFARWPSSRPLRNASAATRIGRVATPVRRIGKKSRDHPTVCCYTGERRSERPPAFLADDGQRIGALRYARPNKDNRHHPGRDTQQHAPGVHECARPKRDSVSSSMCWSNHPGWLTTRLQPRRAQDRGAPSAASRVRRPFTLRLH